MHIEKITETLGAAYTMPCGATVRNRFLKSAMSEVLARTDGLPNDRHKKLYSAFAEGGIGVSVSGNVMVDSTALGEPGNVVMEDQRVVSALSAVASAATVDGAHFWTQINHPGKQSPVFLSSEPVAPSAIPFRSELKKVFRTPRALRDEEIKGLVRRFGQVAGWSKQAGCTGVQIHGAHGYLVNQFMSPLHNQRTDLWGGSLDNRMRFAVEIYRSMRSAVGTQFPVSIKLNSADFQKGGFSEEDALVVVKTLAEEGVDLIEISGGNYESPAMMGAAKRSTKEREAYFLAFAEKVRRVSSVPLCVTGGFLTPEGMASAISSGATDLIGLARALAIDPKLPSKIMDGEAARSKVRPVSTGVKMLDQIGMLPIAWYEVQLARIADGKDPDPDLGAWSAVAKSLWRNGLDGIRQRRAKK